MAFNEVTALIQRLHYPKVITFGIPNPPQQVAQTHLPAHVVAPLPCAPMPYNNYLHPQSVIRTGVSRPGTSAGNNADTVNARPKAIPPILPRNNSLPNALSLAKFDVSSPRLPLTKQPASSTLDQPAAKRARARPSYDEGNKESETLNFINKCKEALSGELKPQNAEDYAERLGLRCIDRFIKKADLRAGAMSEDSKENRMDMVKPQETDEAAIAVGEEQGRALGEEKGRDTENFEDDEALIAKQKTDALRESTKKKVNELKDLFLMNRDNRLELRRSHRSIQDLR